MHNVKEITKWLEENEPEVDFGEIHIVIRKHQGQIAEVKKATVLKGKIQKKGMEERE